MIKIISAISDNGVIGINNGDIPWYLPGDFKRFRTLTMNQWLLIGRKTQQSIYRHLKNPLSEPLKGRKKIVLTHDPNYNVAYCDTVTDWQHILCESREGKDFFIAGGEEIYKIFLPYAKEMYLTRVHVTIPDGDAFFPAWNESEWESAYEPLNMIAEKDPRDQYNWHITDYRRKSRVAP
jgi:dihydrofolate reductase